MPLVAPPPLRPGDSVAVFAGSSPFDRLLVLRGMAALRERYRILFSEGLFSRRGYLAGDDERRANELSRWFRSGEVRAVIAARGGYGLSRVVGRLDWDAFTRDPKWIVGFSDVTVLHVEATRRGARSLHGPNVGSLGRADQRQRRGVVTALEGHGTPSMAGLSLVSPPTNGATLEGPLVGGNLTMLHASATAGRLSIPPGAIVLLEDVTERPYRLDRMVTTLVDGGHFGRASGFLLGTFTECTPGPDGVTAEEAVRARLQPLGLPVFAGAPVGHGAENDPFVVGERVRIDGSSLHRIA